MGFRFPLFGRGKRGVNWEDLNAMQRGRVIAVVKAALGANYRVVQSADATQRPPAMTETRNEDQILDHYARGRLLDLNRNAVRNSATFDAILRQLDVNVVGTMGGKVILSFPDQSLNDELTERFARWTQNADFFDGLSFNALLKIIYRNTVIGGDCVVVFDKRLVTGGGKLLVYEPDEIGNVPPDEIARRYGKGATQSQGRVYDRYGRFVGVTVSRACRGREVFDADKCYYLRRDPDDSPMVCDWTMPRNVWRVGQGRGVATGASSIGTIHDLELLQGYELAAAKANSQNFMQIYTASRGTTAEEVEPTAFTPEDVAGMTDDQIRAAAMESQEEFRLNPQFSAGVIFQQLPPDYKAEILDTKHPNQNVIQFVKWVAGRAAGAFGMSESFATLSPDSNFRAQQLLTWPSYIEGQKFLENSILDWAFYRFVWWLNDKGEFDAARLPDDWVRRYVSWAHPRMDELDEVAHQNAVALKLKNMTTTLREELGADWKEKMAEISAEIQWCKDNGIPHPQLAGISGGWYDKETAKE